MFPQREIGNLEHHTNEMMLPHFTVTRFWTMLCVAERAYFGHLNFDWDCQVLRPHPSHRNALMSPAGRSGMLSVLTAKHRSEPLRTPICCDQREMPKAMLRTMSARAHLKCNAWNDDRKMVIVN